MTDHPFFPEGALARKWAYPDKGLFQRVKVSSQRNNLSEQIDFFYRVDDPVSHLMAQLLLLLMDQGLSNVNCHVVEKLPKPFYPEPQRYEANRIIEAGHLARLYGLNLAAEAKVPDRLSVQMIACQLAQITSSREFLKQAVFLGARLWQNDGSAIRERCKKAEMSETAFRKSETLLRRLGGFESGCVVVGNEIFQGPTDLSEALAKTDLSPEGKTILRNLRPPFSGFQLRATPVSLFLALDCPFSYLAAHRLKKVKKERLGVIRLRPVMLRDLFSTIQQSEKGRFLLRKAAAESARQGLPFLERKRLSLSETTLMPLYARLLKQDDPYKRLRAFCDLSKRIWTGQGGVSTGAISADFRQRLRANSVALRQSGMWGTPTMIAAAGGYWGQDRMFLLSAH